MGVLSFNFIPQALKLYLIRPNPFFWLKEGHAHAIRLLIASPGGVIANLFELSLDEGTTIYVSGIVGIISIYVIRILKKNRALTNTNAIILLSLLIVLTIRMNGRLIFAFLGIMIIVNAEFSYRKNLIKLFEVKILEIVGLVFTMVSSGTMSITTLYIVIMSILQWKAVKKRSNILPMFSLFILMLYPLIVIYIPYFISFLKKNIDFFGGGIVGIIGMLQHGMMSVLNTDNLAIFAIIVVLGIGVVVINFFVFVEYVIKKDSDNLPFLLIINLCVYGGMFGLSTALLCTLPLLVFLVCKFSRLFRFKIFG